MRSYARYRFTKSGRTTRAEHFTIAWNGLSAQGNQVNASNIDIAAVPGYLTSILQDLQLDGVWALHPKAKGKHKSRSF